MTKQDGDRKTRRRLRRLLRVAYSSEMAAAYAYQGHAASVTDPAERDALARIEQDERHHREAVGRMLPLVGGAPSPLREALFARVGKSLRFLCHWSGWTLPMLCAGMIETANVGQYVRMSRYANESGLHAMADELSAMAEVERQHEAFFFSALDRAWRRGLIARIFPRSAALPANDRG